ncbi:MAG: TerB family tellurite resistance protein [Ignavibacteriales bacterium]|nr:TerB family tellurite resistance protein [Ignavibacteriales bacterium]
MGLEYYSKLKNLGYLYLSFAHLADRQLSGSETEEIKKILLVRSGQEDRVEIESLMEDVTSWYNRSAVDRIQVIYSIAAQLNMELETEDEKRSILDDLLRVAKADQDVSENEVNFIRSLAEAWNLEFNY